MVIDFHYWTRVVRKLLIIIFTFVILYFGVKLASFYMPFLVAFIISLMLEPLIRFLMRKLKLKRKQSSIVVIIFIIGIIIGLIAWAVSSLISEGSALLNNINEYVEITTKKIQDMIAHINIKNLNIPDTVLSAIESSSKDLLNTLAVELQNIIKALLNFITSIPTIGIYLSVTFLALYFMCTDKVYMIDQLEHHLPEVWVKKLYRHLKDLVKVLGGYLKAEATLIIISFIVSLVGLYIFHFVGLNVKYPLLYAVAIGFVDALPIFGSGTVMVPWAIIEGFNGDIKLGIAVLGLWIVMSIIRQLIEPRIVGNHIGIHPIFTLIAMYTGFKLIGVIGLFVGPIALIILKNIFSAILDKGIIKTIFSREY